MFHFPALNAKLDLAGHVLRDMPCLRCGYNLKTLLSRGACPECGAPVAYSLRGEELGHADPRWVGRLATGSNLIVLGLILSILLVAFTFSTRSSGSVHLSGYLRLGIAAVIALGYWMLTTAEPQRLVAEMNITVRLVARWAYMAYFTADLGTTFGVLMTFDEQPLRWLLLGGSALGLVSLFVMLVYKCRLAQRLPNDSLAKQFIYIIWAYALAVIVIVVMVALGNTLSVGLGGIVIMLGCSCAVGVMILAVLVWHLLLILRLRSDLNACAVYAQRNWS